MGALHATQDQKIRLHEWSGTALKEVGLLEGNKGVVSAIEFSPDGALLAVGDVRRIFLVFHSLLITR
jgi:WD40 repeat protein